MNFHNLEYNIVYSNYFNSYLGVSAKLSPGAPHGYGDFALVGGSLSQPELLQVNKKDSNLKPSQTATEQGKVKVCLFNYKTTWRGN